ncbi:MAG: response regulator [Dethiobacter sp.]|jgi:DNA-binding NarL/FixJ family response regulator|nr:MAG: response regulator [Dethiobacter sp.]
MENVIILIADNEHHFTSNLKEELDKKFYQVFVAENRKKAQELARSKRPDLVVLGTISPRGEAFTLHQWLKKTPAFSELPLIVIDAPPEKQLTQGWRRDEGLRLEAEDYFRKPLNTSMLVPLVEKLLDEATSKIKVLVADDHAVVREGIRALVTLQRDMKIVGEAIDGNDAVNKVLQLTPDVVLMDIVMPGMSGIEATKQINKKCKKVKILMLSQYDDEENVLASTQAGAFGFIPKRSASSQLLDAIRAAR